MMMIVVVVMVFTFVENVFLACHICALVWGPVQRGGCHCAQWHEGGGGEAEGEDGREAHQCQN